MSRCILPFVNSGADSDIWLVLVEIDSDLISEKGLRFRCLL
ncbi:hypothetical protein OAK86_02525 [Akkermansiaceae bacterium]|nr:hypothetical protein [Akkermansiaceae bacterium]